MGWRRCLDPLRENHWKYFYQLWLNPLQEWFSMIFQNSHWTLEDAIWLAQSAISTASILYSIKTVLEIIQRHIGSKYGYDINNLYSPGLAWSSTPQVNMSRVAPHELLTLFDLRGQTFRVEPEGYFRTFFRGAKMDIKQSHFPITDQFYKNSEKNWHLE